MSSRPDASPRPTPRVHWLLALALALAASVGALAWADRPVLREIGATLSGAGATSLDAALQAKVKSALALSRRVSGMKVDVEARSGVVTLAGKVPTQEARSIVEAIAADTAGVGGVRNLLTVDPAAAADGYEQTLLGRISDLETQVALQERLRREPLLAGSGVKVDVESGMVVLRGSADAELQRSAAERIAQAAVGADHVRDEVDTLGPAGKGEDRLARRVEFELYSTGAFDLSRLHVRTESGQVRLEGGVRSEAERLLAVRLAEAVPGVRDVVDQLTVQSPAS